MRRRMFGIMRRLARLHRLLWMDERVSSLEERADQLRDRMDSTQRRMDSTQRRMDSTQRRMDSTQRRMAAAEDKQARTAKLLELSREQADAFKSNLEVPDALIDEFRDWKADNPILDHPLVSVIVATYNRSRVLTERCIPSVLAQSYRNLELIVVGDHCTDDTEARMAEVQDPRLRFVNLPERGVYPTNPAQRWMVAGIPAMNEGLSLARGGYITHLDDDDEYLPHRLQKLVEFSAKHSCDFVWHPFYWESVQGDWRLNEATKFGYSQVTTSSVFYRSWFKKIQWDSNSSRLTEPGDWNRLRRIKYIGPTSMRYPEPLLNHYRERGQAQW